MSLAGNLYSLSRSHTAHQKRWSARPQKALYKAIYLRNRLHGIFLLLFPEILPWLVFFAPPIAQIHGFNYYLICHSRAADSDRIRATLLSSLLLQIDPSLYQMVDSAYLLKVLNAETRRRASALIQALGATVNITPLLGLTLTTRATWV
jgi:hypothetical protein